MIYNQDIRYAYIVGRLRASETRLLTDSDMERMLEASTFADALRVLAENPD